MEKIFNDPEKPNLRILPEGFVLKNGWIRKPRGRINQFLALYPQFLLYGYESDLKREFAVLLYENCISANDDTGEIVRGEEESWLQCPLRIYDIHEDMVEAGIEGRQRYVAERLVKQSWSLGLPVYYSMYHPGWVRENVFFPFSYEKIMPEGVADRKLSAPDEQLSPFRYVYRRELEDGQKEYMYAATGGKNSILSYLYEKGSREKWMESVALMRQNTVARFILDMSLGSCLLDPLSADGPQTENPSEKPAARQLMFTPYYHLVADGMSEEEIGTCMAMGASAWGVSYVPGPDHHVEILHAPDTYYMHGLLGSFFCPMLGQRVIFDSTEGMVTFAGCSDGDFLLAQDLGFVLEHAEEQTKKNRRYGRRAILSFGKDRLNIPSGYGFNMRTAGISGTLDHAPLLNIVCENFGFAAADFVRYLTAHTTWEEIRKRYALLVAESEKMLKGFLAEKEEMNEERTQHIAKVLSWHMGFILLSDHLVREALFPEEQEMNLRELMGMFDATRMS